MKQRIIKAIWIIAVCIPVYLITLNVLRRPFINSFVTDSGTAVQTESKLFSFGFSRIRYYVEGELIETIWLHTQSDQIIYWRKDADGNMERFVYPDIDMSFFYPSTQ